MVRILLGLIAIKKSTVYSKAPHLRNHLKETFRLLINDWPPYLLETLEAHTHNRVSCNKVLMTALHFIHD